MNARGARNFNEGVVVVDITVLAVEQILSRRGGARSSRGAAPGWCGGQTNGAVV